MMNDAQVDALLSVRRAPAALAPAELDDVTLAAMDDAWTIMTASRLLLRDHPFEADLRQCALRLEKIGMRQLDALSAISQQRCATAVEENEMESRGQYASAHAA